jgi:3-isopropylmalate/(R)-2-methylmalate dehydratase small subunit
LECPQAAQAVQAGDLVSIDFATGVITNTTQNTTYQAEPFPAFMQEIMNAGGLIERTKIREAQRGKL